MMTGSFYTERMNDSYAAYLSREEFNVHGDGIHDDTKGIQAAIKLVKEKYGFGVVFVPEGIYKITDTIYIPRAIRLIGYGKNRPKIILGDYSPGYYKEYPEDKGKGKYMLWFTHKVPDQGEAEMTFDANPGTFYSALSNIDLKIGAGNPSAIALRTHYAQHGFIAHCNIEVGSGKAGIFDVGNEMEDVHIFGGQYGIITTKCSPGWPFVMVDTSFTGQAIAAIKTREAGMTIIRTEVRDTPVFVSVDEGYFEKLYVEDSILYNVSEAALIIACENNTLSQYNLRDVFCVNTPVFAKYRESGRIIEGDNKPYHVKTFTHGLQIEQVGGVENFTTTFESTAVSEEVQPFKTNLPELPPVNTWVNLKDLGAKGDGKTDDTDVIKKAVEEYETIYLPQGWYIVTDTIRLRSNTKLIAMTPIGTQLVLPDNTESFGGLGAPKPLLETPKDGTNIVYGIGIDAGGRNSRAVGCKWMSGESSYMNDVKFMGGHGIMEWGNGGFIRPYNANRTADVNPDRKWDSQYWSLWITNGGGGVFKDVWSASPYANAGLYISDTSTKGWIYAMSLEHHVRAEARFKNVSNWKIFCLQTEEEVAEGPKAQPVELTGCSHMLFANLYMFRVVWVNTPFDYCIKTSGCSKIEFLNLHNYSQMKYTINNMLLDVNTNTEVRPWQLARLYITGEAPETKLSQDYEIHKNPVEKICGGFQFVDGGCCDNKGNFYFADGDLKRIYKIDGRDNALTLIMDAPFKICALACDTEGRIIVTAEYDTPAGATENGALIQHTRPADAAGSSFAAYYPINIRICAYSFEPEKPEETLTALKKIKRSEVKRPAKVLYPGNRWRDSRDYETAVLKVQEECFMGLDGATIIPVQQDLLRAAYLSEAVPGKPFYAVDEYYKRTYEFTADEDGYVKSLSLLAERGDYCSVADKEGRIYVCDGQIHIHNKAGIQIGQIQVPERPSTIAFGGEAGDTLYITAREAVYKVELSRLEL
jgi:hypothetical protein